MSKKIFGRELLVDAYGCNVEALNSLDICAAFLKQAVVVLEVSEQSPPFVFVSPLKGPHGEDWADKAGISGWIPLIESGIQIHTLTPKKFLSVDYYTCSKVDEGVKRKLLELVKEYFHPIVMDSQLIDRGVDYYD
jgi:S-adenosylmethionine/arginine decarboxylase-like enzyme